MDTAAHGILEEVRLLVGLSKEQLQEKASEYSGKFEDAAAREEALDGMAEQLKESFKKYEDKKDSMPIKECIVFLFQWTLSVEIFKLAVEAHLEMDK